MRKGNGKIGEQFVPLTRSVNTRWRSVSAAAAAVIHFLIEEHMRHGGMENGRLKAPDRRLIACGISERNVRSAIDEAEAAGLIEVYRAGMRSATLFKLTFVVDRAASPAVRKPKPHPSKNQKSAFPRAGR